MSEILAAVCADGEQGMFAAIIVLRWSVAAAEFGVAEHGGPCVNPVSSTPMRERMLLRRLCARSHWRDYPAPGIAVEL